MSELKINEMKLRIKNSFKIVDSLEGFVEMGLNIENKDERFE